MERQIRENRVRRLRPPIPGEHGALLMSAAALVTPLVVAVGIDRPDATAALSYALLVAIAATALLFREALQRRRRASGAMRSWLTRVASVEALGLVAFAVALAWLAGPIWAGALALLPLVVVDLHMRRRGTSVPLAGELAGVSAISLAVPAGLLVLEVGTLPEVALLWILFLAFHVGSVIRVQMTLSANANGSGTGPLIAGLGYHGAFLALAIGAWYAGSAGVGAPLAFLAGVLRAGWTVRPVEDGISLKALGRAEGLLSTLFVLCAPLMVP